jgi:tetratricopeptide (TPR) repeat protein
VTTLIERCPNLHIVATSREPLHARYERVFAVDALSLMDDVNGAAAALQLFLSRANAVDHRFDPDVDALLAIRQICARLEGNPLGIELAATWVGALDVADIAREIGENVDFARANFSDVPERHRSLRAAFEHSWSLLSATEQRMLRCLSLFAGEFTREAALSVSGAPISALLSLVNRSLLRRIPGGRYCLHVFVREFAALKADDAPADRRDAEARFCDVFAERAHALLDDFKGRKQREALAALTRDLPDMLRAWRIALAQSRFKNVMRMIEVLEWFYETAERLPEAGAFAQDAVEQLERASALTPMPPSMDAQLTLAWLRGVHGWVRFRQNDMAGMALVHESERWIADLIDPADAFHQNVHALALLRVAYLTAFAGQIDAADAVLPACIEASRRAGRPWLVAMARACAGMLPLMRGDPAAARELLMANLDEWRAVGDAHGLMTCLSFLTNALQALGRADEALKLIGDDLLFVLGYGNRWSVTMATASLARVAQAQGDHAQARQLYLDSIRIFADAGDAWGLTSAMVDFAMFTRDAGDCAKAAELLRAVLDHGSSAPPVAARAAQLLAEIESCEAAPVRVAAGTLWDLAARLTWQRYPNLAGCQPARLM